MLVAALLGARKRVPTWRVGRAQAWMRGHLWLGLLCLPLILFHGGFHFGGTLTRVLMWLLIITVGSGVFGAVLQNYVPRLMTEQVPLETIYAEIGNVQKLLREEADCAMESICGPMGLLRSGAAGQRAGGFTALRPIAAAVVPLRTSAAVSAGAGAAVAPAAETIHWRSGKRAAQTLLSRGAAPVSGAAQQAWPAAGRCAPANRFYRIADVVAGGGLRDTRATWKTFVKRRDNWCGRNGCIAGCTDGGGYIYRCRWP